MVGKGRDIRIQRPEPSAEMSERTALILLPRLLCDARLWKSQADALDDIADIIVADMTLDDTMAGMAARALDSAPAVRACRAVHGGGLWI
jgi:hypothetical protein